MKPKVAIVRGKFLNRYEMQFFEPLVGQFDITAFGSQRPFHDTFVFPAEKLMSPMDIPEFPYKMPILNRLFVDAQYLFGLEEKLKGFDLVHTAETYYHYTRQALTAKRKGYVKKVIATVLENIPHNNEGIWGRSRFKARARKELDHMIALTQKTRDALIQEGADSDKITVISHFVDTKRFAPSSKTIARRGSPQDKLTILFVGRLETYKGVLDILEAARLLLADEAMGQTKLKFLFVGEGSQKSTMLDFIRKWKLENYVEFRASLYDGMPKIYELGDIFVAPSKPTATWMEQYCTALLEAQAAGLPIVTTRSGGIPENIGDAGLVVEPGNVSELASALKGFIVHEQARKMYGAKAMKQAKTVHDIRIGAQKMSQLYAQVLQSK
jgi:glycosyltransferase involved in cell wall biosynthesis